MNEAMELATRLGWHVAWLYVLTALAFALISLQAVLHARTRRRLARSELQFAALVLYLAEAGFPMPNGGGRPDRPNGRATSRG